MVFNDILRQNFLTELSFESIGANSNRLEKFLQLHFSTLDKFASRKKKFSMK